jgi:hypothetical protein
LHFSSLAMTSLRWDLHPQERAHAGHTTKKPGSKAGLISLAEAKSGFIRSCVRNEGYQQQCRRSARRSERR